MSGRLPVLLAALLLTGCASVIPGSPQPAVWIESRGPAGAVPPGLDRFYRQPVAWSGCESFATRPEEHQAFRVSGIQCGRVQVPLDYAKPDGKTVSVALLRRPADEPANRIGSLLINPGGPGGSGMMAAASLAGQVAGNAVGRRFDLVGFDPRGIGASQPQIRCLTTEERDAERLDHDLDTSPAGVAQTEQEEKDYAAKCAERVGVEFLANIGSREVAKDMDVLRAVLGDTKLTYVGYSYGTRIGTAYASQFPANVRAMVLDGALDPEQSPVDELVALRGGFQGAFNAYAARCASQQDCPLGNDPAQATARFRELVKPLVDKPIPVGDRQLSYDDAITGVIRALYTDQLWRLLDQGMSELANGQGRVLLLLADDYYERSGGQYSTLADALQAVRCVDDPPVTDRALVTEADRRSRAAAPFLDDGSAPSSALDVCAFWPVPPTGAPSKPNLSGLPPVLVISTTGDPATPYQAGVALAEALGGRLLTFEGHQHTVFLQNSQCVNAAGIAYLVDGTLPPEGARCSG